MNMPWGHGTFRFLHRMRTRIMVCRILLEKIRGLDSPVNRKKAPTAGRAPAVEPGFRAVRESNREARGADVNEGRSAGANQEDGRA
jgi:hypothetical protein